MVLAGPASSVLQEEAARHVQLKLILGAAHGDVQKPTLLLDLRDTVASLDGRTPSTTLRTRTIYHSRPFAE